MIKSLKLLFAAALFVALVSVPTALAATVKVAGGTWTYGVTSTKVYSKYYHSSKYHAASVHGLKSAYSGKIAKKVTAKASTTRNYFGVSKFYYKVYK